MRTRSASTDSSGCNTLPGQGARTPPGGGGGGWFKGKFGRKFGRKERGQDGVKVVSITDGHHSPCDEEPLNGGRQQIELTFEEYLEANNLKEACHLLINKEDRLFGEIKEAGGLKRHEEEVNKLQADYKILETRVLQVLFKSFVADVDNPVTLTSAVNVISQQEAQDQAWKSRDQTRPSWRPCAWKTLHDEALINLVKERMDNPSIVPATVSQSSVETDIQSMGRQLKEDLLYVVDVLKSCYSPHMDICNFYAREYHQTFSARLRKIADFGLEDKDCEVLLRWVNEYYPGLLQKPEFVGVVDAEALGKLLSEELLQPLEEQYLSQRQSELMKYIKCVLEEAKEKWNNGEEPMREDGYYVSTVAYDTIQLIHGRVTGTGKVVGDLQKAQSITSQLSDSMKSFKLYQDEIIKQNKPNSKAFIKANLNSIEQFRDVLTKNKRLFLSDVRENCLQILTDMKESAHTYLLSPVHELLRPRYRKLGTNDWLKKPVFDELLGSIKTEIQELQGSKESCHQELICRFHQDVAVEYVRRLLKGDVKLKNKDQQYAAFKTVRDNAESLHALFASMGSQQEWLKEILTKIAEVLKLQELPAIQMQIMSLGLSYPDLSEKHVSALLKLKTNFSKADRKTVKATLTDTLNESGVTDAQPFFSKVQVK